MSQPDWSARLAEVIGREVHRYRKERGMTGQQLADAVTNLGMEMKRPVLSNLENGRRGTVSVAEVLILADALGVPAALLVFPLGRTNELELMPGAVTTPMEALERALGRFPIEDDRRVYNPPGIVERFERYQSIAQGWVRTQATLHQIESGEIPDDSGPKQGFRSREYLLDRAAGFARSIKLSREAMQRDGLVLPPLPAGLAGLDESQWPTRGLPDREVDG